MTIYQLFTSLLCLACHHLHFAAGLTTSTSSQVVLQTHEIPKRVVGDVGRRIEEIPYLISFRKPKSKATFCTGTLITSKWALTAAHCFEKTSVFSIVTSGAIAVAGATAVKNADEKTPGHIQTRKVDSVYIHHLYDSLPSFRHDLAMVQLDKHFELSDWLHVPLLPRPGQTDQCTTAVIPGWRKEVGLQKTLKCAFNTTISSSADCYTAWQGEFIPEKTICSADLEGKSMGLCYKDAGSPLVCQDVNASHVVVGIFSQTKGCSLPKQLRLYSRVDAYMDWIDYTMKSGVRRTTSDVYLILMLVYVTISRNIIIGY